jgi:hypothetical protein
MLAFVAFRRNSEKPKVLDHAQNVYRSYNWPL